MSGPREGISGRTRLINDTAAEIARLLGVAADEIAQILAAQPSDYQQWRLPLLQAEIRRVLGDTAGAAALAADASQVAAWSAGAALVDGVIAAPSLGATLPALNIRQMQAMREFTTEKIKGATLEAMGAINDQLALTMIGTQTPFDAVQAITKTLGESTRKRATGIVRTELATAYSTANQLRLAQWGQTVPGLQKRWVKSGKLHPRLEHVAIHNQVRDVDQPFDLEGGAVKMMHPHDPTAPARHRINCGCVSVPVVPGYVRTIIDTKEQEAVAEAERAQAALERMRAPAAPAARRSSVAATLDEGRAIYGRALAGGKHAGLIGVLQEQGPNQWRKAIAAQTRRMEAHQAKLANPAAVVPDWAQRSPQYQQGLIRKWRSEVEDAREQIMVVEGHRDANEG